MGWIAERIEKGERITAQKLYNRFGFRYVLGVYIHARVAIAGPICVSAVVLKPSHKLPIKPAKELTFPELYELNDKIRFKALSVNLGWASVSVILKTGLQRAIQEAIRAAVSDFSRYSPPSIVLVDNFILDPLPNNLRVSKTPVINIRKGTELSDTLAAASIVGKVAHHDMMKLLHKDFPEYDWINNSGYATKKHIELIKQYGITPQHRDLSGVKALEDFEAFANERWRRQYANSYFGK